VSKGDVIIGTDVWIGYGSTILSGVRIGDGAVNRAKAVVATNVESYSIFVGNPGRSIGKLFDEETMPKLLEIRWWDWPLQKIKDNMRIILSSNISKTLQLI